jgi:hypothetical protein
MIIEEHEYLILEVRPGDRSPHIASPVCEVDQALLDRCKAADEEFHAVQRLLGKAVSDAAARRLLSQEALDENRVEPWVTAELEGIRGTDAMRERRRYLKEQERERLYGK